MVVAAYFNYNALTVNGPVYHHGPELVSPTGHGNNFRKVLKNGGVGMQKGFTEFCDRQRGIN